MTSTQQRIPFQKVNANSPTKTHKTTKNNRAVQIEDLLNPFREQKLKLKVALSDDNSISQCESIKNRLQLLSRRLEMLETQKEKLKKLLQSQAARNATPNPPGTKDDLYASPFSSAVPLAAFFLLEISASPADGAQFSPPLHHHPHTHLPLNTEYSTRTVLSTPEQRKQCTLNQYPQYQDENIKPHQEEYETFKLWDQCWFGTV
jgi:hypothetical protein